MNKAVIYTRFSPRRNADQCESCEVQLACCEQYAATKKLEIVSCYHDRDVSGKDEYRDLLWQAISAIGKGDVLLVYKRDRLARNVYLAEQINRAVSKRGGTIAAATGDVEGDEAEHVMVRQVLAAIAEYERKLIAARTRQAMRQHQMAGRRMSRMPPYGWGLDPCDRGKMILDERELNAVKEIKRLARTGRSYRQIMDDLNMGFREASRSTNGWTVSAVHRIAKRDYSRVIKSSTLGSRPSANEQGSVVKCEESSSTSNPASTMPS